MNKVAQYVKNFITEEDGSVSNEYGSVYLMVAIALFVVYAAFHGGLLVTVQTIASEFVTKLDSLSIANSGHSVSM